MLTQKQIKQYLKDKLDKHTLKRLRPVIVRNSRYKKDGNYIALHIPVWININADHSFEITENSVTYHISNSKVSITIWKDVLVPAYISVNHL